MSRRSARPVPADPVVVVCGASSGIGRAIAHAFARRGARLVLAARRRDTLQEVAADCAALGAQALVVPTDVTDAAAVRALGEAAITRFGRIDAWINDVGVGAVGRFEQVPLALHRRVVEANLLGHLHGAHVALGHFRARGRGLLVEIASIGGWLPAPYAAAYAASKFALRGLVESLQAETADQPGVHVCAVYPTFVDTPGVAHGANYVGRRLRPPPPLVDAREVARRVAGLLDAPRAAVFVGPGASVARLAHALAPATVGRATRAAMDRALARADRAAVSDGNLFEPSVGTAVDGGYRRRGRPRARTVALAAGAIALAAALGAARRRRARALTRDPARR
jgi:short-subunit dehydrogenase